MSLVPLANCLSFLVVAASGLATPDPGKGAKPVQVEFDAPAGCSSAGAFFRSLSSRTDEVRPSEEDEPHTTIQVRLTRNRGRVLGELRVVDDRGKTDTRKVHGASCDDVVEALSLTAALAVDPNALLSAPATAPAPNATADAGADTNATPPVSNPPATKKPDESTGKKAADLDAAASLPARYVPWLELGAGALGTTLLTSGVAAGIAVSSRWTLPGSGLTQTTLGLAFTYARNDLLRSPGAVQVSLTGLEATACPLRLGIGIFTVQPCAMMMVGWFVASGREATYSYDVEHLWLSAGGVVHAAAFLTEGLSFDFDGGVSAPFYKRRFFRTSSPGDIIGETPSISPLIRLGMSYGF